MGSNGANDRHQLAKQRVPVPLLEHRLGIASKPDVVGARKILPSAINSPSRKGLRCSYGAERDSGFATGKILTALAARERQISRLYHATAREPRDQICVSVFRLGAENEHTRRDRESAHEEMQLGRASLLCRQCGHPHGAENRRIRHHPAAPPRTHHGVEPRTKPMTTTHANPGR